MYNNDQQASTRRARNNDVCIGCSGAQLRAFLADVGLTTFRRARMSLHCELFQYILIDCVNSSRWLNFWNRNSQRFHAEDRDNCCWAGSKTLMTHLLICCSSKSRQDWGKWRKRNLCASSNLVTPVARRTSQSCRSHH